MINRPTQCLLVYYINLLYAKWDKDGGKFPLTNEFINKLMFQQTNMSQHALRIECSFFLTPFVMKMS